ncbi:hypothetical protein [Moorella sp. Hama-1]|uniref:hypothetical protein n=1 Tax=Moorella sp. Hama-1 TaxID=2138101 RepID=UPI000D650DCD|nr:hypothetical protein [Moorella sp. Hama-1]BCV21429.1 hypothetical protein hamaS1_14980 [Moorella sp. Hama-1]
MVALFNSLRPELEIIHRRLVKETSLPRGLVSGFTWPALNEIDNDLLPALVLLSSHGQGYFGPRALSLAVVLQLIFLASLIHSQKGKQGVALQTLIGDYFYTRFFDLLCRDGNLEFLETLSQLICHLHLEGAREQEKALTGRVTGGSGDPEKGPDRASLALVATRLGSQLGKTAPWETRMWQEIGQLCGHLWSGKPVTPQSYQVLAGLPPGPARDGLGELFLFLTGQQPAKKVMAL